MMIQGNMHLETGRDNRRSLRRRVLAALLAICLVVGGMPGVVEPVYGLPYNSNLLGGSWGLENCHPTDGGFEANDQNEMKIYQDYYITDPADMYRIDEGEYKVYASGSFWHQGVSTIVAYVKADFYNASGGLISTAIKSIDDYGTAENRRNLSTEAKIPAGTRRIRYEARNDGSLDGRVDIKWMSMTIVDEVKPFYEALTLSTMEGPYKSGTQIRYQMKFSEPVAVKSGGYLRMNHDGNGVYVGQNPARDVLYYDYTIPSPQTGSQLDAGDAASAVKPLEIIGVSVTDDAGQAPEKNAPNGTDRINPGAINMDNKPPVLIGFEPTGVSAGSSYKAGEKIQFVARFHEFVKVTGTPTIALSGGGKAVAPKTAGGATSTKDVTFTYTVQQGDNTANLKIDNMDFSGITDGVGQGANESPSYSANLAKYKNVLDNLNISVDTTPPTVGFAPAAVHNWAKALGVRLTLNDNITGVKNIWAAWAPENGSPTWPGNPNVVVSDPMVADPANGGALKLHVKAADKAGNEMIVSSGPYLFDNIAPIVTLTRENLPELSVVNKLTAGASDDYSGIKALQYKWLNEGGAAVLEGNIPADGELPRPAASGIYSVVVTAEDKAGNIASKTETGCHIDVNAPEVTFTPNGSDTVKHQHSATVTVTDAPAGIAVDRLAYQWSKGETAPAPEGEGWTAFASGETITMQRGMEGSYFLYVRVEDRVGNLAVVPSKAFKVDNVAPDITMMPDGNEGQIGLNEYEAAVAAEDKTTPAHAIDKEKLVTTGAMAPAEGFESLTDTGVVVTLDGENKYLHVRAKDEAGNVGSKTSQPFIADIKAPTGTIVRTSSEYTNQPAITVAITGSDDYTQPEDLDVLYKLNAVAVNAGANPAGGWESLTTDKTLTVEAEGIYTVTAELKDRTGNEGAVSGGAIFVYDKTAPQVEIQYSAKAPTTGAITAWATATDGVTAVPEALTTTSHTFTENGSFTFQFRDQAGNVGEAKAVVDWIDHEAPVITIETGDADGAPHRAIQARITATDVNRVAQLQYRFAQTNKEGQTEARVLAPEETMVWEDVPESGEVIAEGGDGPRTLHVRAQDEFGHEALKNQTGFLLDNTVPTAAIKYTPATRTAQDVESVISFNEAVSITNNEGKMAYTFTDNGEFTFEFADTAGNTGSAIAKVTWIDRTIPVARIILKEKKDGAAGKPLGTNDWTNQAVEVTLVPPPGSAIENVMFIQGNLEGEAGEALESEGSTIMDYIYTLEEYGKLTFVTKDIETQVRGNGEIMINIDREAPGVTEILRSTEEWTKDDVTVTVKTTDFSGGDQGQTHVFNKNGAHTFTFVDKAGNRHSEIVEVKNIDKDIPVPTVKWTTADGSEFDPVSRWTNQNVTVTLSFPQEPQPMKEPTDYFEHVFEDNGSHTFNFTDGVGNVGTYTAILEHIDRIEPTGYATLSKTGWTNKDVTATLYAKDDKTTVSSADNFTHVFGENGLHTFVFTDEAGNKGSVGIQAERIDKTPPTLTPRLTPPKSTAFSVYATVKASEPVTILNNGGKPARRFESNGSFTFEAVDRAGNTTALEVVVKNITKETTPVKVEYSTMVPTGGDVTATLSPEVEGERIYVLNNAGMKTYTFRENGEFIFQYTNDAGIAGEAVASVSNINKTPPVLTAEYSTKEWTNKPVTVTVSAISAIEGDMVWPYGCDNGIVTFGENAARRVTVRDPLGNQASIVLEVKNIDVTAPVITLEKPDVALPLKQKLDLTAGVSATDNTALAGELQIDNGGFNPDIVGNYIITYAATDQVGNRAEVKKTVAVYDPNAFNVIVNGRMAAGAEIRLNSRSLELSFINAKGQVTVKYLGGKQGAGVFKTKGTVAEGSVFTLPEAGYYTLYAMDELRQAVLIQVFVQ